MKRLFRIPRRKDCTDAQAIRWLRREHYALHAQLGEPVPGNCVICYMGARLYEQRTEIQKLRLALFVLWKRAGRALGWKRG